MDLLSQTTQHAILISVDKYRKIKWLKCIVTSILLIIKKFPNLCKKSLEGQHVIHTTTSKITFCVKR